MQRVILIVNQNVNSIVSQTVRSMKPRGHTGLIGKPEKGPARYAYESLFPILEAFSIQSMGWSFRFPAPAGTPLTSRFRIPGTINRPSSSHPVVIECHSAVLNVVRWQRNDEQGIDVGKMQAMATVQQVA